VKNDIVNIGILAYMSKNENLINNIGESFFDFQSKLQFFEREYLRKCDINDISISEIKVLYRIGISNTKSMSDIANELKITKGTLSITVNSLVKKGYVIRNRHKQDRRVIILYLTTKAIKAVKTYQKFYVLLLNELVNSDEDSKTLLDILKRLNAILNDEFYED